MDIGPIGQRDLLRRNHRRRNAFYYRGSLHPDTLDWLARVAAVGGSVSGSTIAAADQFARSVEAGGFRSRINRLNLFCGNNLTTALVPFYVGTTLTERLGNSTDTNNNFVSADFTETGSSGGLVGNASNKYLLTGTTVAHLGTQRSTAVYVSTYDNGAFRSAIGSATGINTNNFGIITRDNSLRYYNSSGIAYVFPSNVLAGAGLFQGRSQGNTQQLTINGVPTGSDVRTAAADNSVSIAVMANNNNGTPETFAAHRLSGYMLGQNWTEAQTIALWNAWRTFHTSLGRP